jgi:hypothetical protein
MMPEAVYKQIRERMNHTGIGLAGVDGVWWLPAAEPFALPRRLAADLAEFAHAIFALFDVVTELYGTAEGEACGLNQLLEYKLPPEIPRIARGGHVLAVRPDFQLRPIDRPPGCALVATELEICPSTHGFAHAMQLGYGLGADLVAAFARLLRGRELLFVGTSQWSEFLFEQLAFCRALEDAGARARVLYDEPLPTLAAQVAAGERWRVPMFGIPELPAGWNPDIKARVRAHGFERFVWPHAPEWPADVGDAVVFRFGYFDCFTPDKLQRMAEWEERGATFLNPTTFILDSKVVLAALQLPAVRKGMQARNGGALAALDRCIPETILIEPGSAARLRRERDDWVVKYAGFDRGNQAWGGRSLRIGASCSANEWAEILDECLALPWPIVGQRAVPTARIDIAYLDSSGEERTLRAGSTRLRAFMLRDDAPEYGDDIVVAGAHLTIVAGSALVSESIHAVQAPLIFRD